MAHDQDNKISSLARGYGATEETIRQLGSDSGQPVRPEQTHLSDTQATAVHLATMTAESRTR